MCINFPFLLNGLLEFLMCRWITAAFWEQRKQYLILTASLLYVHDSFQPFTQSAVFFLLLNTNDSLRSKKGFAQGEATVDNLQPSQKTDCKSELFAGNDDKNSETDSLRLNTKCTQIYRCFVTAFSNNIVSHECTVNANAQGIWEGKHLNLIKGLEQTNSNQTNLQSVNIPVQQRCVWLLKTCFIKYVCDFCICVATDRHLCFRWTTVWAHTVHVYMLLAHTHLRAHTHIKV